MPKFNHPEAVTEIPPILDAWATPSPQDLATLKDLTGKSLDTVTHLTEYEDEKANRVLTAMAFISAFAAVLFGAVISHYSGAYLQQLKIASYWRFVLLEAGYGLFAMYAAVLSIGVAFSLYGMKPRFNYPKASRPGSFPKSLIFFEKINEVAPSDWARAFSSKSADELAFIYTKNNILETYLISGKIPVKLKPLQNASILYIASTCILLVWVTLTAIAVASIDVFPSRAVSSIKVAAKAPDPKAVQPDEMNVAQSGVPNASQDSTLEPAHNEMLRTLEQWKAPPSLDKYAALTTKSLDTVSHLAEFEDEKANRILTAIAFISTFVGVLFAAVVGHYSGGYLQQLRAVSLTRFTLIKVSYIIFGIYALLMAIGVLFSLYGMTPAFVEPQGWKANGSEPGSFLFYGRIREVSPSDWANAFTQHTAEELSFRYVKNNIAETYFVSEGIGPKLKRLRIADAFYFIGICILFVWIVITGLAVGSTDFFPNTAVAAIKSNSP
jgi:hypothetical protein